MRKIYVILLCIIIFFSFQTKCYSQSDTLSKIQTEILINNNAFVTKNQSTILTIDTCIAVRTSYGKGMCALVWDYDPNQNFGTHPDFTGNAWTSGGTPTIGRCLMNIDLHSILPMNALITNATLDLYHDNSSYTIGHSTIDGPNDCWLRRITSSWNETTVNWNTQPSYTTTNEVYLPASSNDTMNYPNIDVTNLLTDIWNNYSTSFGFMIMLNSEQFYRSLLFGSNDCADPTKRPLLHICYHFPQPINENFDNRTYTSSIFPNPTNCSLILDYSLPENSNVAINFYSITGKLIDGFTLNHQAKGKHEMTFNLEANKYSNGIYFVRIITDKATLTNRFVKID